MRQLTASVAVLLSLACVFSCKKEKGGGDALEKIYFVDPASATMVITQGRSEQILYATVPEKAADTAILEWFSDDPSIADVINGLVTAVAPGNTVITAKCGNVTASVDVQVVPIPVTSFSVPKTMSAYMDMPVQIKLTLEPAEANAASLEWKSDNPEIAEVVIEDGKAIVNAKKEGGCKISVSPYGRPDESKEIAVTVYPAAFKLMRRTISGESGYVEIPNDDSFDITDIGMPTYEGIRCIEMIRVDGGKLLESSVEVYNENSGIVSITKRQRSESKILLEAEEKSEAGATKVSVSLKEDDNVYTKTFTITRQKHDFTSDTKICRINTETPVNDVEEMARNATMEVQMFPAVNAVWTSSNESVAKVVPATSDGKGFSPMAEIRTFGEYGSAEITATDESGEHTRKFTVKVSKASFPAGTKICIRVNGKIEPVGESTTIRASYDGRNDEAFGLMDASGNYLSTFTNFKWTIESPSCECRLATVGASGVVVTPISTTAFSGSKTATLVCTDDAGNQLRHKIIIYSPNAFGYKALGVKVGSQMLYSDAKVDIGNKAVVALYGNKKVPVTLAGVKWSGLETLKSYGSVNISTNSTNTISYCEFTPNKKMESVTITVEDEIGEERTLTIQSAAFHFPDSAKIYISYDERTWNTSDDRPFLNNGNNYFRIGTSATDLTAFDPGNASVWSSTIRKPSYVTYTGNIRVLPSGNSYTYAMSTMGYPNDYECVFYTLTAKDAYGKLIESEFRLKKFMNFNDDIWFRFLENKKYSTYTYKFESGKDVYVTVPLHKYTGVKFSCSPSKSGSSVYFRRADIVDFSNTGYTLRNRTEKPALEPVVIMKKEEYSCIIFYDDYGNTKTFYVKKK